MVKSLEQSSLYVYITNMLLKIKSSLHDYFRTKRLKSFAEAYPDLANLSVLDVGGTPYMWEMLNRYFGLAPKKLVLLNSNPVHLSDGNDYESSVSSSVNYTAVVGDARDLKFADSEFDLVFSNSVIEHVGSSLEKNKFARGCERVGKEFFIQTPNRWFPIEPHIVTFFIHWLPRNLYKKLHFISVMYLYRIYLIIKNGNPGHVHTDEWADGADLLSYQQLRQLFPDNGIYKERLLGLSKSFVVSTRKISI